MSCAYLFEENSLKFKIEPLHKAPTEPLSFWLRHLSLPMLMKKKPKHFLVIYLQQGFTLFIQCCLNSPMQDLEETLTVEFWSLLLMRARYIFLTGWAIIIFTPYHKQEIVQYQNNDLGIFCDLSSVDYSWWMLIYIGSLLAQKDIWLVCRNAGNMYKSEYMYSKSFQFLTEFLSIAETFSSRGI